MSNNESLKEKEHAKNVQDMFNNIAGRYDFLNGLISLKLDDNWRKKAIKLTDIHDEHTVLDLACGTGDMLTSIRKTNNKCKLYGADFSINMLKVSKKKMPECQLIAADAHNLPFKNNSFDRITMAFGFRNVSNKNIGLTEMYRVLKNNGKICILELTQPENKFINFFYKIYFKHIMPFIAGVFSSKKAYTYLPDSVYHFPKRKKYKQMIEQAGFKNIHFKSMLFGAVTATIMEK